MLTPDSPINFVEEDCLERRQFVESLAQAIINYKHPNKDCLVIGLYGEWGSGKTSIVNMLVKCIESMSKEANDSTPMVLDFNPWLFSDQHALIRQFFDTLSKQLGRVDKERRVVKLGKKLEQYSKALRPFSLIPGAELIGVTANVLGYAGSAAIGGGEAKLKDLKDIKEDINGILSGQDRKLVIIIDDIDRLTSEEVRQMFSLVKMLADFKNTIYLLSFDRKVVSESLDELQEGAGEKYLEKIIQVPFEISPISRESLNKQIGAKLKELDIVWWDNTAFTDKVAREFGIYNLIRQHWFSKKIRNLRDINRFMNVYRFKYSMLKDHVNTIDLFALTFLEVFSPRVCEKIREDKNILTSQSNGNHFLEGILKSIDFTGDEGSVLTELFPALKKHGGRPTDETLINEKRLCHPNYFEKYFSLSL